MKILLHGALGVMGQHVQSAAAQDAGVEIACGVDKKAELGVSALFPLYGDFSGVKEDFDVIVDFSVAAAVDGLLSYAEQARKPVVLCTTGLSPEQLARLTQLAKAVPVLRSANMSIGINLLLQLVREAAAKLYPAGFDIEVVEQHHRRKLDAPSGTAMALADAAKAGAGAAEPAGNAGSAASPAEGTLPYVYDRSSRRAARPHGEIGISAVRGGTIPGVHDVIFAGEDEVITIQHTAYSRAVFAKGALAAARFLKEKAAAGQPGLYSMQDVLA